MVDFKSIETFLWVVTLGSFRGAAQKLPDRQDALSGCAKIKKPRWSAARGGGGRERTPEAGCRRGWGRSGSDVRSS